MRATFGAVFSIAGAVMLAYAIVAATAGVANLTEGSCIGGCVPNGADAGLFIGGMLLFIISAFLWVWSWVTGPVSGLAAAAFFLSQNGVSVVGRNLPYTLFIVACVLLGPMILVGIAVWTRRRQAKAVRLATTGSRAVALVRGAQQTGIYINERPQLSVTYLVRPLDGSAPFEHTKRQTLDYAGVAPKPGLQFPAWYDPADPSEVALGIPSGAAPDGQTLAMLQQFGLTPVEVYGYDPFAGYAPGL